MQSKGCNQNHAVPSPATAATDRRSLSSTIPIHHNPPLKSTETPTLQLRRPETGRHWLETISRPAVKERAAAQLDGAAHPSPAQQVFKWTTVMVSTRRYGPIQDRRDLPAPGATRYLHGRMTFCKAGYRSGGTWQCRCPEKLVAEPAGGQALPPLFPAPRSAGPWRHPAGRQIPLSLSNGNRTSWESGADKSRRCPGERALAQVHHHQRRRTRAG